MIRLPPGSTRTDTLVPSTTLCRSVEPGVLRQPEEDLLHEILRFGRIAQALAEETQQRRIIALRDLVERMLAGRTGFVGMCCASHRCLRRGLISVPRTRPRWPTATSCASTHEPQWRAAATGGKPSSGVSSMCVLPRSMRTMDVPAPPGFR